jgi:hypothetical protein
MKHIFYLHSYITYIVALGTIKVEKIPKEDVLFIFGRKFKPVICPYQELTSPAEYDILLELSGQGEEFGFVKNYSKIKSFDKWLSSLALQNDFQVYLPNRMNYYMQLMASHPKCKGYHIIEEGLLLYSRQFEDIIKIRKIFYSKSPKQYLKKLAHFFRHGNRSSSFRDFKYDFECKVYGISPVLNSILHDQNTIIVPILPEYIPLDEKYHLNNVSLFFMDALVEQFFADKDKVIEVYTYLLDNVLNKNEKLYIKFHPAQSDEMIEILLSELEKRNIDHEVIPPHISAEMILMKSKNLKVYGFFSSLLYYALIFDADVYSLSDRLKVKDKLYEDFLRTNIPDIAKQAVTML